MPKYTENEVTYVRPFLQKFTKLERLEELPKRNKKEVDAHRKKKSKAKVQTYEKKIKPHSSYQLHDEDPIITHADLLWEEQNPTQVPVVPSDFVIKRYGTIHRTRQTKRNKHVHIKSNKVPVDYESEGSRQKRKFEESEPGGRKANKYAPGGEEYNKAKARFEGKAKKQKTQSTQHLVKTIKQTGKKKLKSKPSIIRK